MLFSGGRFHDAERLSHWIFFGLYRLSLDIFWLIRIITGYFLAYTVIEGVDNGCSFPEIWIEGGMEK